MKSKRLLVALAALLVTGILLGDALAKGKSRSSRRGHSSSRSSRTSAVARAYASMIRAAAIRAAAVRAARAEVSRASRALTSARTILKREFEFSPEMSAALADHQQADARYALAKQPILEQLGNDPEYQAALAAKERLHDQGQALRRSGRGTSKQFLALIKQEAEAGAIATKLQAAAIRTDPQVRQAGQRVLQAAARVTSLKREFEGSITRNSRWTAARNQLDQARSKLAQAYAAGNKALANAQRSYSRSSGRR